MSTNFGFLQSEWPPGAAKLHTFEFSGSLLSRGFWLYVWIIETSTGDTVLYVGRTGDSSSPNAQSPFNRLSQHLGSNKRTNTLRRHLLHAGIGPETCAKFEMVSFGPIFPEGTTRSAHDPMRNKVAAMERALRDALHNAGYQVLNQVHCRHTPDQQWPTVLDAFATRFPKLKDTNEVRNGL